MNEAPASARRGDAQDRPPIDISTAHPARVYDFLLGGKDNYAADRAAAEAIIEVSPVVFACVRANRAFLRRAVRYLAREAGIRQFLDIGTGLPTAQNTHQVAQQVAPECKIVYVDNDPIVLAHARALLASSPEGACDYIDADLRDTDRVLARAAETLDFGQPVAVMVLCTMQYVPDADEPHAIIARLVDAVPSGSFLTMSDTTRDIDTADHDDRRRALQRQARVRRLHSAHRGRVRPLLRWPVPGRPGPGPHAAVAPGPRYRLGRGPSHVRRHGTQAVAASY